MLEVYLIPVGSGRYEPYCEPAADAAPIDDTAQRGVFRRLSLRFHEMLARAEELRRKSARGEHVPAAEGWLGRTRDRVLRRVAEHINEQRLLWHLRKQDTATLHHPDDVAADAALDITKASLSKDADRHLLWLVITTVLFIASGALALVPGPNLLAYFLGFFVVAHYLSWRGARHGLRDVVWSMTASAPLSELRAALGLDQSLRASKVLDIAARLRLDDLPTFVERVVERVVPARA